VVTDPHDGKSIGIRPPSVKADIVLMSHNHFDHNKIGSVGGPNTKVIQSVGGTTLQDVKVQGFPTFHDEVKGDKRGDNIIFIFEMDGIRLCHLGDLGHVPESDAIARLGEIDVLFVPVGGVFTVDAANAWKVVKAIDPKVVVPMHYRVGGLSLSIQPLAPFTDAASEEAVVQVGNEIDFSEEDLPDEQEIWVFSL
jgi:L-ascorbate metabolism protein UlaG (beta-lactamase superfamily)